MGDEKRSTPQMRARVDFVCIDEDCHGVVLFNVMELRESKGQVSCPSCHREYRFDVEFLEKLERLRELVLAVMNAEDILGDVNVAVTTPAGTIKVPYRLLLTRLNSIITLQVGDQKVDFHFRIEPLHDATFK